MSVTDFHQQILAKQLLNERFHLGLSNGDIEKFDKLEELISCLQKQHPIELEINLNFSKSIYEESPDKALNWVVMNACYHRDDFRGSELTGNWQCLQCDKVY